MPFLRRKIRINESNCPGHPFSRMARNAFTLIELLVVIAIISLLVSILLPSLQKARNLAKQVVCMSNQKGAGFGLAMYAEDHDGWLPIPYISTASSPVRTTKWSKNLLDNGYIEDYAALLCPSFPPGEACPPEAQKYLEYLCYGMTGQYKNSYPWCLADAWNPSKSEIVVDSFVTGVNKPGWISNKAKISGDVQYFAFTKFLVPAADVGIHARHQGKADILFLDFHVELCDDEKVITKYYQHESEGTGHLWEYYTVRVEEE